jgi:hypothetical protein
MHDIPIIMLHSVNAFPDIHPMGRLSILPHPEGPIMAVMELESNPRFIFCKTGLEP